MSEHTGAQAMEWKRVLLAPAGFGLLILANTTLNRQVFTYLTAIVLIAGIALWMYDTWLARGAFRAQTATNLSPVPIRWWPLAISAGSILATWVWSSDNTFRPIGVVCWVLSIGAWFVAWWPTRRDSGLRERILHPRFVLSARDTAVLGLLILAVAGGVFFRFYRIDETPLDPTSDHAEKLTDISEVLEGKSPIFFERNAGRGPAQMYVTAGLVKLLNQPVSFTTLKVGTALIGALSIIFVYLLAAEFAGRMTGLFATGLYAIGTWPVEISRAGLLFPYALIATAPVLWFLLRWMRTRDRRDALFCGLSTGIGLYGYAPFRIVVLAVCLGLAFALIASKGGAMRRRVVSDGLLIGATAGVMFVPLGRYAIEHPDMFWFRAGGRLTGKEEGKGAFSAFFDQIPDFLRNNWNAFKGFNWRGDSTYVNAVSNAPMLDLITGALLLAGLAAVATHAVRRRDARAWFLLAAIPILLLSSTLAIAFPWENPSVNREGPAAPVIFTIAAIPFAIMVRRILAGLGDVRGTIVAVPVIAVLIATSGFQNFDEYFHDFDGQTRASVDNTTEIARVIRGAAVVGVSPDDVYIIDWPHWIDIRNVGIAMGDFGWGPEHNVTFDEPLPPPLSRPMLLILNHEDAARLADVERTYPNYYVTHYAAESPGQSFVTVFIPAPPTPLPPDSP